MPAQRSALELQDHIYNNFAKELVRSCIPEPNRDSLLGPAGRPAGWPTRWIPNALDSQRVPNALDSQRVGNALRKNALEPR